MVSNQAVVRLIAAASVVAIVGSATPLSAQAVRGTIQGTVTDASGGALPGVAVETKNIATGVSQMAVTNAEGRYTAPDLPLGEYEVTASLAGFQTVNRRG